VIEEFLLKIRRQENGFYAFLYRTAKTFRTLRLPAPRPIFTTLYYLREMILAILSTAHRILWVEPLFRSRCTRVGSFLYLFGGIPYVYGRVAIYIGDHVTLGRTSFEANKVFERPEVRIGDRSYIGDKVRISVGKKVTIGQNCYISDRVYIADHDGHPLDPDARRRREPVPPDRIRPIVIEDDVWIGRGAIILKGVRIGHGAVVGAGSVLANDVPPLTVVSGNPARVVKQL